MKKILILGAFGFLITPLHAEDYKIPKTNSLFSISFPDNWSVTHESESVDAVTDDNTIQLNAQLDDAETLEKSIEESITYLIEAGVNIDADSKKEGDDEINGLKVGMVKWDAKDEDGECNVSLSFIDIGGDKVITLLYWGSEAASEKHGKALMGILKSMKALKPLNSEKTEEAQDETEDEAEDETKDETEDE